jgi:ABC-type bacteriocin/lantibiotic exporter with double-glycine peptidase domain
MDSVGHDRLGTPGGHGSHRARPFTRLLQLLQPEWSDIRNLALFASAVAVLSLATPIAIETLVNTVAFGVLMWPVFVIAGVLMVCLSLAAAIKAMQIFVVECMQRRLFVRVLSDYSHRFPNIGIHTFDTQYGPELANRFFDILTLQKSIAVLLLDGLSLAVATVVGMSVLASYHPALLGFDIVMVIMIGFTVFILGWGGVSTSLQESRAKYEIAGWLEELLRSQRAFKTLGGQRVALERADSLAIDYMNARQAHFRIIWRQTIFALTLQVAASTMLLGLGGWLVICFQLTLGQLVAAELIVSLVVASVSKIGKYAESYYDLMSSAEKLGLITDLPLDRTGGEILADNGKGMALRVRPVHDKTTQADAWPAIWDIHPHERIAMTGPSGTGKTRFLERMCGLREARSGCFEMDGIDANSISLDSLRHHSVMVGISDLIHGTVLENIRMGRAHVTSADVRESLKAVGLLGSVQQLKHGLDTLLIPGGLPLSGSQVPRLLLARALVGRPRLLVLDGTLDAINFQDCPDLLPLLFDRSSPWTLLVVSNRNDVLVKCDRVLGMCGAENEFSKTTGYLIPVGGLAS